MDGSLIQIKGENIQDGDPPPAATAMYAYVFCDDRGQFATFENFANGLSGDYGIQNSQTDSTITDIEGNEYEFHENEGRLLWHVYEYESPTYLYNDFFYFPQQYVRTWGAYGGGIKDLSAKESYVFSAMSSGATKEEVQEAYWMVKDSGGSVVPNGGSINGSVADVLAAEGTTYEAVLDSLGITPTISGNDATVSYSFAKDEFLIGPFSVNYSRYFFFANNSMMAENGKVNFSLMTDMKITIDGNPITLNSSNFVYPNERSELAKKDTGYAYPHPNEEFYIRLSASQVGEGKEVTGLTCSFRKMDGYEGKAYKMTGTYVELEVVSKIENWSCPGGSVGACGNLEEHGAHEWSSKHWVATGRKIYNKETGKWEYECKLETVWHYCSGTSYCQHGHLHCDFKKTTHVAGYQVVNTGDSQSLLVFGSGAAAKIMRNYATRTQTFTGLSLRMNYGGTVWEDEHTGKMQDQDGQLGYNENGQRTENGIKNIKVTIYNKENGQPYASTYTDENGNYMFSQIKMGQYYAVFEYDGQTWEPTSYFVGGDANFATNSKAQENEQERINFNNKFKEMIETGALSNTGVLQNINYNTATQGKSFALTNDDGKVEGDYYSFFRMTATTMDNNYNIISYPRENEVHIEDWDKTIAGTTYVALYPDIEHINLGLVRRSAADFEVRKDVYKAIIQINGKTEEYTYSSRDNITESFDIEVKMGPDYGEPEYNRAIYRSDYNYRISDYADGAELNKQAKNARGGENAVDDMISAITEAKGTNSELKIYIIYKITIANRSSLYAGTINELVDYYDQEYTYTGESWYGSPTTTQNTVTWTNAPKYNTAKQYDGYNTMYTQTTGNMMLKSGEMVDIYVKFEVNKHTDENGKADSIILDETLTGEALGGKNNVVEITNYSTFKEGTTIDGKNIPEYVEGKIDKDSRPGSAVPGNQATYEDDTDGAPRMNIILHKSVERSIYGYVWEDNRTNTLQTGQIIGNGYREDNETLINGAVVQLIEKVEINGQTYEYIWREMETGDATMKYLDYDGNLQTDTLDNIGENDPNKAQSSGKYFFNKYIPGNYIVRFIYGDNASTLQTSENGGKNAISYNGQDYKSTIYTAQETTNAANERFYNFASVANASKARDNAFRRLNVNKYSEVLNNHIGNVLYAPYASPNDTALMQELRDNTWMYADTAIINATVAYNSTSGDLSANTGYTNSLSESQNTAPVYIVENMGFGLEERPRTNIVLTKQIENATITLTDGTVLLDTANGIRSGLQAQPNKYTAGEERKSVQQGIWAFQIDDELLQGAELKIYYRLSVENNGQIDTVGQSYDLDNVPSTLLEAEAMLGNSYYYGTTDGVRVVTTSVDKILDYVDRSIAFNADMETNNGVWYSIENINDLKAAGLLDENITITDNTTTNKLVMTETLQSSKLDPVENTGDSTVLVLTRILGGNSSEEDYTYVNLAEIIQLTNEVGRKDPHEITGDTDPNIANENEDHDPPSENDTDESEIFTIIPPTGLNQSMIYIIIAVVAAGVFITGIVLIKKFAIKKK